MRRCSGKKLIAIVFPIVDSHVVWTVAAPLSTVLASGVKFTPRVLSEQHQTLLKELGEDEEWSAGQTNKDVSCCGCGVASPPACL